MVGQVSPIWTLYYMTMSVKNFLYFKHITFFTHFFLAARGWITRGCFASFCKQTGSAQCYECEWINGKIGLAIAEKSKGM